MEGIAALRPLSHWQMDRQDACPTSYSRGFACIRGKRFAVALGRTRIEEMDRRDACPTVMARRLPGLFLRSGDGAAAFGGGEIGLFGVIADHARGGETRDDGPHRGFHHLDPAEEA